jgi:hypothetical protein
VTIEVVALLVVLLVVLFVAALWRSAGPPAPIEPRSGRVDAAGAPATPFDPAAQVDRDALRATSDGARAPQPRAAASGTDGATTRTGRVTVALARPDAVAGPWRVRAIPRPLAPDDPTARRATAAREFPSPELSPHGLEPQGPPPHDRPSEGDSTKSDAADSPWSPAADLPVELELEFGAWELAAHGAAWSTAPRIVDVVAEDLAVVLEPRLDTRLVGRCVGRDGSPLADLDLGLLVAASAPLRAERFAAQTDVDGVFVVENFPAGPGQLVCGDRAQPFVAPRAFEAEAPTTDLGTLVFEPLATLTVEVVDAAGAPLAGVDVVVVGHPRGEHRARTDLDGRMLVAAVPATEGRAFADVAGLGRGNAPFQFDPSAPQPVVVRLLRREDDPRAR